MSRIDISMDRLRFVESKTALLVDFLENNRFINFLLGRRISRECRVYVSDDALGNENFRLMPDERVREQLTFSDSRTSDKILEDFAKRSGGKVRKVSLDGGKFRKYALFYRNYKSVEISFKDYFFSEELHETARVDPSSSFLSQ